MADGATLEASAAGPGTFNDENPFNNPNGSQRDQNGADTGSVPPIAQLKERFGFAGKGLWATLDALRAGRPTATASSRSRRRFSPK